jgi:PilZ domain
MRLDGRTEKRIPMMVSVYLIDGASLLAEEAFTENVSGHGVRVLTRRFWRPGEQLRLAPLSGKSELPARVVYCQGLANGFFRTGLEFQAKSVKWDNLVGIAPHESDRSGSA